MNGGRWQSNEGIARVILASRPERRRALTWLLIATMIMMGTGLWVIDGWLAQRWMIFALWWAGCGLLTLLLMLFAIYDMLMVLREERETK
ncbi:MAG: hypothetical protein V4733_06290 [Verrucomicrobiota bacterium]